MKIFAFSCSNLTNIWAGVGAGLWAVSKSENDATNTRRRTLADKMPVGAFGLLYCSANHSYTTPFVVYSKPDADRIESSVWAGDWVLPFSIKPLGNPRRLLDRHKAASILPSMGERGISNPDGMIYTKGTQVFVPSEITDADWSVLIKELAI